MKSVRSVLLLALVSFTTFAFAQGHDHKSTDVSAQSTVASDAQKSFDEMKTFAGDWEGPLTVDPPQPQWDDGNNRLHVSMRITSRGNAIVHEMQAANTPLDPSKYDHPLTMFYVDNDRLNLVHYCDAGNRPHMIGKLSPDGKKVEFDFLDLSGGNKYGHMYHAVFTAIDANHHTEDWTYMMPGDKPVRAHFDLRRTK